jgi:hypothetical protein
VEQYFVLDPQSVTRLGPSAFRCRIPRMSFFSVWLEPEVEVEVLIAATHVHMRSRGTHLHGSEFVQRSGLNDRFDMFWCTTLTWGDQVSSMMRSCMRMAAHPASPPAQLDGMPRGAYIDVQTEVKVWCEVLPPFNAMPRSLLSGACNAVLRRAVPALLNAFVRQLAGDYRRWALQPEYRQQRRDAAAAARPAGQDEA